MAILFGTTSTGTTLPVLVDQYGNLLAQGMPGVEGPPGPPGGAFALPPNPVDGDVLGWENGQLVWNPTPPLPAGTYGPFVYYSSEDRLEVPQTLSLLNGQQLFMSDADGNIAYYTPTTSTISSVVESTVVPGSPMQNANAVVDGVTLSPPLDAAKWQIVTNSPCWTSQNPKSSECASGIYIYANNCGKKMRWNFTGADVNATYVIQTSSGSSAQSYNYLLTGDVAPTNGSATQAGTAGYSSPLKDENSFTVTQANGYFEIESGNLFCALMIHYISLDKSSTLLTFNSPNTDLQYFAIGDVVQAPDVQVTAIDLNANTMTVSGGTWQAGTSTITAPDISGTGTVSASSGNSIILSPNNNEWINGFYVSESV